MGHGAKSENVSLSRRLTIEAAIQLWYQGNGRSPPPAGERPVHVITRSQAARARASCAWRRTKRPGYPGPCRRPPPRQPPQDPSAAPSGRCLARAARNSAARQSVPARPRVRQRPASGLCSPGDEGFLLIRSYAAPSRMSKDRGVTAPQERSRPWPSDQFLENEVIHCVSREPRQVSYDW